MQVRCCDASAAVAAVSSTFNRPNYAEYSCALLLYMGLGLAAATASGSASVAASVWLVRSTLLALCVSHCLSNRGALSALTRRIVLQFADGVV